VIRHTLVAGAMLLGLAHDPGGCGSVDSSSSGPNAPCTRSKDCRDGLTCERGVCSGPDLPERDAGVDATLEAGPPDASGDATADR
jgi:hypothetical protein